MGTCPAATDMLMTCARGFEKTGAVKRKYHEGSWSIPSAVTLRWSRAWNMTCLDIPDSALPSVNRRRYQGVSEPHRSRLEDVSDLWMDVLTVFYRKPLLINFTMPIEYVCQ